MIESFAYAYSQPSASLFDGMAVSAMFATHTGDVKIGHGYISFSPREMRILNHLRALSKDRDLHHGSPQIIDSSVPQRSRLKALGRLSSLFHLTLVWTDRGSWKLINIRSLTKPRIGRPPAKFVYSTSSRTSRSSSSSRKSSIASSISECDTKTSKHSTCHGCDHDNDLNDVEHGGKRRKIESNNQMGLTYTRYPQTFSTTSSTSGYNQQANNDDAATAEVDIGRGPSKKQKPTLEDPLHCLHVGETHTPCCGREGHGPCSNRRSNFKGHATFSHLSGHLCECHNLLFCFLCWSTFPNATTYRDHINKPCTPRDMPSNFRTGWPADLLQLENQIQLFGMMVEFADFVGQSSPLTDEEKWEKTWKMLHPGCEDMVPSCYFSDGTLSTTTTTDIVSVPDQQHRIFPMVPPMPPSMAAPRAPATAHRMRRRNLSSPIRLPGSQGMARSMTTPGGMLNSSLSDSGAWPSTTVMNPQTAFNSTPMMTLQATNPNQWMLPTEDASMNGQIASRLLQDFPQDELAFVSESENQQVPGMAADTLHAQQRMALSRSAGPRLTDIAEDTLPLQMPSELRPSSQPETDDFLNTFRNQQRHHQPQQYQHHHHHQRQQRQQQMPQQMQQPLPRYLTLNAPQASYQQNRPASSQQLNAHQHRSGLALRPGSSRDPSTILAQVQTSMNRFEESGAVQRLQNPALIDELATISEDLRQVFLTFCNQLNNIDNITRGNT